MNTPLIPIHIERESHPFVDNPSFVYHPGQTFIDKRSRALKDLRISVTDRCNFRCVYCMPKEIFDKHHDYLPYSDLLSFEEIARIATQFVAHGTRKIRLTGGEPLLRKNIEELIHLLSLLRTPDGEGIDISLTTNGSVLSKKAAALAKAGLKRITISLDAIDNDVFKRINDVDYPVQAVLDSIDIASEAGLGPIKINMVVKKGLNEDQILPMVQYFKGSGHILRFIEFMDVGTTNAWHPESVITAQQIIELINQRYPLQAINPNYDGEVAKRWMFADGGGEIGIISSISQTFCHDCTRARLSTEGKLYLCLFAQQGYDLRGLLRSGCTDQELAKHIAQIWSERSDNYSERRHEQRNSAPKIEMSYIGG